MPADEAKISATRSRPTPTMNQVPVIQEKPASPWVPFSFAIVLILATAGGLFYYMDMQFKSVKNTLETKLLKTNDFVVAMDKRLKKIEDSISASDADADAQGSSLTSKMLNLESRLATAEKNVGWNSSRVAKQVDSITTMESSVSSMSATVNSQASKVSANTTRIEELANKDTGAAAVAELSKKVEANGQAIETIDAHRSRLSSAIQTVQSDTARLIRLYEKDNPSAKRVH